MDIHNFECIREVQRGNMSEHILDNFNLRGKKCNHH
jgi:hypothetical protein